MIDHIVSRVEEKDIVPLVLMCDLCCSYNMQCALVRYRMMRPTDVRYSIIFLYEGLKRVQHHTSKTGGIWMHMIHSLSSYLFTHIHPSHLSFTSLPYHMIYTCLHFIHQTYNTAIYPPFTLNIHQLYNSLHSYSSTCSSSTHIRIDVPLLLSSHTSHTIYIHDAVYYVHAYRLTNNTMRMSIQYIKHSTHHDARVVYPHIEHLTDLSNDYTLDTVRPYRRKVSTDNTDRLIDIVLFIVCVDSMVYDSSTIICKNGDSISIDNIPVSTDTLHVSISYNRAHNSIIHHIFYRMIRLIYTQHNDILSFTYIYHRHVATVVRLYSSIYHSHNDHMILYVTHYSKHSFTPVSHNASSLSHDDVHCIIKHIDWTYVHTNTINAFMKTIHTHGIPIDDTIQNTILSHSDGHPHVSIFLLLVSHTARYQ